MIKQIIFSYTTFAFLFSSFGFAAETLKDNDLKISLSSSEEASCHIQNNLAQKNVDSTLKTLDLVGVRPHMTNKGMVRPYVSVGVQLLGSQFLQGVKEIQIKLYDSQNDRFAKLGYLQEEVRKFERKSLANQNSLTIFNLPIQLSKAEIQKFYVLAWVKTASDQEYVGVRSLNVTNDGSKIVLLNRNQTCYKSMNPKIISDLKHNDGSITSMAFQHQIADEYVISKEFEKHAGFVELGYFPNILKNSGSGAAIQLYSQKNFVETHQREFTRTHEFEIPAKKAAYLVKWDTQFLTPATDISFDRCGLPEVKKWNNTWFFEFVDSYQMMAVDPALAYDQSYVNNLLTRFKEYSDCNH